MALGAPTFVSVNVVDAVRPPPRSIDAVTLYVPGVALPVAVTVEMPAAFVVVTPLKVADAPEAGTTVYVTVTLLTARPLLSVTRVESFEANALLVRARWPSPA